MEIVRARNEFMDSIMEIERECFSIPWSENSIRFELASADAIFPVAVEDGQVLGFGILHKIGDEGELFNLVVSEERRGEGIGAALLDAALLQAKGMGVEKVYLEVRRSNTPARKLYESRGFAVCGMRKNYYEEPREDAMLMDLELQSADMGVEMRE